jgi:hypothetical protein
MNPHAPETMIRMVMRPEGATLSQLMRATGWQRHSVRGFVSKVMRKEMGMRITRHDRAGCYREIVMRKPLDPPAPNPPTRWSLFGRWMEKWFPVKSLRS